MPPENATRQEAGTGVKVNMSDSESTEVAVAADEAKTRRASWRSPVTVTVTGGVVGIVIGAVGVLGVLAIQNAVAGLGSNEFQPVLASCGLGDNADTRVGDNGKSLTVNGKGTKDASGISLTDLECLMGGLKTPDGIQSHISQTTSLDGRQTETWGDLSMSWSYHPDRGLDAVYTVVTK